MSEAVPQQKLVPFPALPGVGVIPVPGTRFVPLAAAPAVSPIPGQPPVPGKPPVPSVPPVPDPPADPAPPPPPPPSPPPPPRLDRYVVVPRVTEELYENEDAATEKARELVQDTGRPYVVAQVVVICVQRKTIEDTRL